MRMKSSKLYPLALLVIFLLRLPPTLLAKCKHNITFSRASVYAYSQNRPHLRSVALGSQKAFPSHSLKKSSTAKSSPFMSASNLNKIRSLYQDSTKADTFISQPLSSPRGYLIPSLGGHNTVSDTFDIYVISVDRQSQRLEALDERMQKNGLQYHKITAADGLDLISLESAYEKKLALKPKQGLPGSGMYSRGAMGASLSHMKALHHASQSTKPYTIILEDDLILDPYFGHQLAHLTTYINSYEFDYLFLGMNTMFDYSNDPKTKNLPIVPLLKEHTRGKGAFAYVVNNRASANMLSLATSTTLQPADHFPWEHYDKISVKSVYPVWMTRRHSASGFDGTGTWQTT